MTDRLKERNVFYVLTAHYFKVVLVFVFFYCSCIVSAQVKAEAGENHELCFGESVQIGGSPAANSGSGDYSYAWSPTDGVDNPMAANPNVTPDATTVYTLEVTDNNTLETSTDNVIITVIQLPAIDAGADQSICISSTIVNVSLWGKISGITNTGVWTTTGDGYFPPGNDIMLTSYTLGELDKQKDTVAIILTSTNNQNCQAATDTLNLLIFPRIVANAGKDTVVCHVSEPILIEGNVSGGSRSGTWTTDGFGMFSPSADSTSTYYFPHPADTGSGFYLYLTSTKNNGCTGDKDSIMLTIIKSQDVYAGEDTMVSTRYCSLNPVLNSKGKVKWSSDGQGYFYPSDSVVNSRYFFTSDEILTNQQVNIYLSYQNSDQCPASLDTVVISTMPDKIPNAFTPNDDGINDVFLRGDYIEVYNRWGQKVFAGEEGWDGRYKGERVSTGTYFFVLKYLRADGFENVFKGSVTVIVN